MKTYIFGLVFAPEHFIYNYVGTDSAAPQNKDTLCISDHTQSAFFCLGKFMKKLTDDQCSLLTKGSIYYIKYIYMQPFSMKVE